MSIKNRLIIMSFLQFFVWGAWLITVGNYWFTTKQWSGAEFGAIFSTLGLSSILMPALTGIIADKWVNAEKLYGVLHILGGLAIAYLPQVNNPTSFYWVIFAAMMCYMPTISLSNSVAYYILKDNNYDIVKVFPPIRVWGTVGFIAAMWLTNLSGNKASVNMFYISAFAAMVLGIYSFTLPKCPPQKLISESDSFLKKLGLDAFKLFGNYKMALFFVFSMFLGGALQLTNMYGDTYLSDFAKVPQYANSFVVKYSTIIMSISQISETLFILAIPFFLKRFGIKQVMLISMLAWVLRFGLFSYGNPTNGLWMIIMSCVVYGMAFDFFNISGSLFVETTTDSKMRSSAQGLFMMMSNGFGAFFGGIISGFIIDKYFTINGKRDWHNIWLAFAIYALVVAILFAVFFKHKHNPKDVENVGH
ncbi:nucleoside permease [Flavobacterium psychrophilum]|uniref:Major facilitator superfamily (MFS), H+ Symporter (NHS) family, nucleoside permease n=1 Tax=Flavobacterium psychrophilum (strain ATCC 49511 / DSM 21280 / CIP 103535 / JIP02/86) TaxID=402612 RepID=A6H0A5_FLAPJ|nr:nucleoside permease [Flavobacterium psychrophilum]AIG30467.1 nucleoside permease [Flavobacterium psychrophilum]AIG32742.1 nucleoside permease [Flavobacterium psychrophilum]AIG34897.1 nucleoside permease [Flavobacterium psychrophilum]AIG37262.1 nucleoside permease [Flavobacterium psychrophilum]AIG39526.1 nucleoside permease [Flavobacterium psychrophilum]